MLNDKNMLKKDLREKAGISINVHRKICMILNCNIEDILEIEKSETKN